MQDPNTANQGDLIFKLDKDRASDSGSESRGFESLHARKIIVRDCIPLLLFHLDPI